MHVCVHIRLYMSNSYILIYVYACIFYIYYYEYLKKLAGFQIKVLKKTYHVAPWAVLGFWKSRLRIFVFRSAKPLWI